MKPINQTRIDITDVPQLLSPPTDALQCQIVFELNESSTNSIKIRYSYLGIAKLNDELSNPVYDSSVLNVTGLDNMQNFALVSVDSFVHNAVVTYWK